MDIFDSIFYFQKFKLTKSDVSSKLDQNKAVTKAVKLMEAYLLSTNAFNAEKLQKNFKSNKSEFLRLIAIYPQVNFFKQ